MPRGGRRPGAGRPKRSARVLAMPAVTAASAPPASAPAKKTKAPSPPKRRLTRDAYKVWARLAPAAAARGTLTVETVHGFALLCDLVVTHERLTKQLETDGWAYTNSFGERKRHALWGVWQNVTLRVEQQLARFGLIGEGRPLAQASAAPAANPWAAVAPR